MTYKLLLALAMSAIVLVGCEDSTVSLQRLSDSKDATPSQVQRFLNLGADVNARDKEGWTPLMSAVMENTNPEVISVLLTAGADVNAKMVDPDGHDCSPLTIAVGFNKNPEVISVLIKAGADVNARDNEGWTPLMVAAAFNENHEVISVLLDAGADAAMKNSHGLTALDYADDNYNLTGTQALKELEEATNP